MGSLGAGGKSVFALDVTDTANLDGGSVMWEFTHADLGYVLSPIAAGKLKDGSWAAVFGNGVDSDTETAQLFIVDLDTGILKKTIPVPGAGNGMGGVRLVKDINNVVVAAYAGDLKGRMWRFDLESNMPADWGVGFDGAPLFEAEPTQAALATPEYILHPSGGQLVIFGTGRLYEDTDPATTDMQSLYGVWDKVDGSDATIGGLEITPADSLQVQTFGATFGTDGAEFSQSSSAVVDYDTQRGWQLEPGLRNIFPAQLVRGFAFFSTVAPVGETSACKVLGATGYGILVSALFGGNSLKPVLDTNGDGAIDEGDQLVSAFETRADGVNRILTGREGKVSIQGVNHKNGLLPGRELERIWRQIMNPPTS
jgi:type IV pilus assembly protein PilY1